MSASRHERVTQDKPARDPDRDSGQEGAPALQSRGDDRSTDRHGLGHRSPMPAPAGVERFTRRRDVRATRDAVADRGHGGTDRNDRITQERKNPSQPLHVPAPAPSASWIVPATARFARSRTVINESSRRSFETRSRACCVVAESVPLYRVKTYAPDGGWPHRNRATIPLVLLL